LPRGNTPPPPPKSTNQALLVLAANGATFQRLFWQEAAPHQ
jgi:hypothetical protein